MIRQAIRGFFFKREEVMQVNSLNQRIGKISRTQLTKETYFRTCGVFLFNNEGKMILTRRADKILYPLYWDAQPGGVVRINESDEESAKREIKEELSVTVRKLVKLGTASVQNEGWFWWASYFKADFEGDLRINEELSEFKVVSIDEIWEMIEKKEKFTPQCLMGLKLFFKKSKTG